MCVPKIGFLVKLPKVSSLAARQLVGGTEANASNRKEMRGTGKCSEMTEKGVWDQVLHSLGGRGEELSFEEQRRCPRRLSR